MGNTGNSWDVPGIRIADIRKTYSGFQNRGLYWTLLALISSIESVVELVFAQLRKDKPYEISVDFIMELGNAYLLAKAARFVKELN